MLMTVFLAAKQVIQRQPEIHSLLLLIAEICTCLRRHASINGAYSDTKSLLDYGFDNFSRAAVKEKKEISFSCLPAEKYLIKDYQHCVLFYSMRTPSVALPNGTDTDSLKKNYTLKKIRQVVPF